MTISASTPCAVAVLFGGRSSEHEISLRSAVYILKNIPKHYSIIPVGISRTGNMSSLTGHFTCLNFQSLTTQDLADIIEGKVPSYLGESQNIPSIILPLNQEACINYRDKNQQWRILNLETNCVFPVLHGPNGEDGRLQGLFELAEMACVGCDSKTSAIGMDKDFQKRLVREAGVPIAKYHVVHGDNYLKEKLLTLESVEKVIGYPCFIKPNSLGSAVGTNKASNRNELEKALENALAFDKAAIIEELLEGTEVEIAFLGTFISPRVSIAGEIVPKNFYSYEEKYSDKSETQLYIPARLELNRMKKLQNLATKVAKTLRLEGLSRIDFWNIKGSEDFLFNEVNTLPGMTPISMFPQLWENAGLSGPSWIQELIELALIRQAQQNTLEYGITRTP